MSTFVLRDAKRGTNRLSRCRRALRPTDITTRTHQGRNVKGRGPYQDFIDGLQKNETKTKTATEEAA